MNLEDSDELKGNKKFSRFQSELQRVLVSLERTPLSDWASLNNGLVQIQKVVDSSSYADLPVMPERLLLCRVLGKCLDPMGAMGVHKKAVETLNKVCVKLGPRGIAASLPVVSVGILHLLPTSAMQTRPEIITLLETHFMTLPLESLAQCLPGIVAAIVLSLEESDTSELYRRSYTILQSSLRRFEEANLHHLFYHALWSTVRNAPASRVGTLIYLRTLLKRAEPLPSVEDQLAQGIKEYSCESQLSEASLANLDTPLVLSALRVGLMDKSEKCLRLVLDCLVFHFPLHEEGVWTFLERVQLVASALRLLVTNPQNSTLRRVFMWIYGGNEYNTQYYRTVSSRYITQALIDMFCSCMTTNNNTASTCAGITSAVPRDTMPFEILQALLSRPEGEEHFHELIPDVISSACGALQSFVTSGSWNVLQPSTQKIFKLFESMPWSSFLSYVLQSCSEVESFATQGSTDDSCAPVVLKRMQDVLDATRLHYISSPFVEETLTQTVEICVALCRVMEAMATTRSRGLPATPTHHIRLTLEVFHVAYFGVTRGLFAQRGQSDQHPTVSQQPRMTSGGESSESASPMQRQETSPLPASPLTISSVSHVIEAFTTAFTALCNAHCGDSGPLSADDILSSGGVGSLSVADAAEVLFFGDMCDTMLSLLSHEKVPASEEGPRHNWLISTDRVVQSCGHSMGVSAAALVLEAFCGDLLTPKQCDEMKSQGMLKRLLQYLWPQFSPSRAEHHALLTKLFVKLSKRSETQGLLGELMQHVHSANCRQFHILFRLVAEQGVQEHLFAEGLGMMLSALANPDASVRLIASSFVEQSLPYLHRITEPLLTAFMSNVQQKAASSGSLPQSPSPSDNNVASSSRLCLDEASSSSLLSTLKQLLQTSTGTTGAAIVQRMWSLPLPSFSTALTDLVDDQGRARGFDDNGRTMGWAQISPSVHHDPFADGVDNDMIVNNQFSLILFVALRILRYELKRYHNISHILQLSSGSPSMGVAAPDEISLSSSSVPSIVQGEESRTATIALDVITLMLRCSVSFRDPPETVANACQHFAVATTDLLSLAIAARLPTIQVQLVELQLLCVTFLDQCGKLTTCVSKRSRGASEMTAPETADRSQSGGGDTTATGGKDGADLVSVSPPHQSPTTLRLGSSRTKRLLQAPPLNKDNESSQQPTLSRETLRMLRSGILAAAVAEVHPSMGCYGLLNHWRLFATCMLPLFHDLLHDAVYEVMTVYCNVVRAVRERPFSPCTALIIQKCFQGITEMLQYLFKPSTKISESNNNGAPVLDTGSSKKLESVAQLPLWLLQQGLGSSTSNTSATDATSAMSNYDLAMKELLVCLETLMTTCLETYLTVRHASQDDEVVRHRESASALQSVRQLIEAPIKVLMETLLKDMELEFYDRLILQWTRRNSTVLLNGGLLQLSDVGDDALTIELLCSSAGVTPASVILACDQLLLRLRRGTVKNSNLNRGGLQLNGGELPTDVAVFHFLCAYFNKCKGADRFDRVLTPLLDIMAAHVSASPSPTVSALAFPLMLKLLTVVQRRFVTAVTPVNTSSNTGASLVDFGARDRRCPSILCKTMDAYAAVSSFVNAESNDEVMLLAVKLLADIVPEFSAALVGKDQSERVSEAFGNYYNKSIGPIVVGSMNHKGGYERILQLAPKVNAVLSLLYAFLVSGDALVPRKLKSDLIDILFSQSFFKMSRQSVSKWRQIFEKLTTDRSINTAILQRFNTQTTPQSMLTAIVQSQDDEASSRARYLKRLAFYVFSTCNLDREFINGIREKLSETFRQFSRHSKLVPVRYALLVFRVLMTRVPAQLLSPFWPTVLPELIRCLSQKPTGDDDFYLAMEALKVVDFAVCVLPSEFQLFRWVFLDDTRTVEALHSGSTQLLRAAQTFVPLIRMQTSDATANKRRFTLSSVRKELCPVSLPVREGLHRPLLAIPERCYFDLRGIDVVCSALHAVSNATSDSMVGELDDGFAMDNTGVGAMLDQVQVEREAHALIRLSDQYDVAYVDWLLETEFLHVGVAASEQKALNQQQQAASMQFQPGQQSSALNRTQQPTDGSSGQPASGAYSPSLSPRDASPEFVDVA